MATLKVLGQSYPSAATATTLYTCGVANGTVVSTINVSNTSSTADTIRVAVRPAGATLANQHYQVFGLTVPGNGQYTWQCGITLANTDVVTIYSTNGTCAFSAFGQEQ
jgi:hypothetical protein